MNIVYNQHMDTCFVHIHVGNVISLLRIRVIVVVLHLEHGLVDICIHQIKKKTNILTTKSNEGEKKEELHRFILFCVFMYCVCLCLFYVSILF